MNILEKVSELVRGGIGTGALINEESDELAMQAAAHAFEAGPPQVIVCAAGKVKLCNKAAIEFLRWEEDPQTWPKESFASFTAPGYESDDLLHFVSLLLGETGWYAMHKCWITPAGVKICGIMHVTVMSRNPFYVKATIIPDSYWGYESQDYRAGA